MWQEELGSNLWATKNNKKHMALAMFGTYVFLLGKRYVWIMMILDLPEFTLKSSSQRPQLYFWPSGSCEPPTRTKETNPKRTREEQTLSSGPSLPFSLSDSVTSRAMIHWYRIEHEGLESQSACYDRQKKTPNSHPKKHGLCQIPIGSMYAIYGNMDPINIPQMLA